MMHRTIGLTGYIGPLTLVRSSDKKADIALHAYNPISELRDVTCRMGSHNVTCHPTQVNVPRLTPAMLVLDLPTPEGWKAELT